MSLPHRLLSSSAALLAVACASGGSATGGAAGTSATAVSAPALTPALATSADSAVLVTRLGADTLVIERIIRRPGRVDVDVLSRVPRTMHTVYWTELTPAGELARYYAETHDLQNGGVARRDSVTRLGDSLRVVSVTSAQTRAAMVAAPAATIPFIDMLHWPYELVLARAANAQGTITAPMLTGTRVTDFRIERIGGDSVTITFPQRGTMRARMDARGRLLGLDAAATTRKLVVERRGWMSFDQLTPRWLALDAAGRNIAALSGRAQATGKVGPVTVNVDYGTPAARGRAIWGALVPFGERWRTGANEATHITVEGGTLIIGAQSDTLVVPAGRYTISSIPEQAGGTLIVNRQTGQGGTTYDAARDLGRVRLTSRATTSHVEQFTIAVEGNELKLQWADRELVVPVRGR